MISADTNVFIYAMDPRDSGKHAVAKSVVAAMERVQAVVGLQVVGELQNVLRRRLRTPPRTAYQFAQELLLQFPAFSYDERAVEAALGEAIAGRLSYWDALLVSAADAVGVRTMLSEDMADGFAYRGLHVVNPFGPDGPSARVRSLLAL